MRKFLFIILLTLCAVPLLAQSTGTAGQQFGWSQVGPDLPTVQAYTYKHYDDANPTGVAFATVTCTGTASPFSCSALIPAYTPGSHTVVITASNVAGESPKSTPFAFTFVAVPAAPSGITIH